MSNLQQLLQAQHNFDYSVSGGMGTSIEDAIVIPLRGFNSYTSVEYICVNCILKNEGAKGQIQKQRLMEVDGRHYDCLTFSVMGQDGKDRGQREFYFNITDCLRSVWNEKNLADPEMQKLQDQIVEAFQEWRREDPKIDQALIMLSRRELYIKDVPEEGDYLVDQIFKHSSYPLFKRIYDECRAPIITVLLAIYHRF